MPLFKCTFFFVSGVTGWSESYYNLNGLAPTALLKARALAQRRIALCGEEIDLPYIRVSDVTIRGDSITDGLPGFCTTASKKNLIQVKIATPGEGADVAWTAAVFTIGKAGVTYGRVFARGMADFLFTNDRVFSPTQGWIAEFKRFQKEFGDPTNGWIVTRKPKSLATNTFQILSANAVFGTDLALTVAPGGFAGALGQPVAIRGLKTIDGKTFTANAAITTIAGNVYSVSRQFTGPQPTFLNNSGTIQLNIPVIFDNLDINYSQLATSRHAGRPFGLLVGRRKKAKLLL